MTGPYLITGAAGFIGFHLARRLLAKGERVVGVDALTPYYDVSLKRERLAILDAKDGFENHVFMLEDGDRLRALVEAMRPATVIHLAAQAGVRYGLEAPRAYIESNIVGTFNLLEACRLAPPRHLMIASTSSVYGDGEHAPFNEGSESGRPLSLYAATKKSMEVIAHAYSHLHRLPTTVFRFFTVYGPWGRPDMALFKFTDLILRGREIEVYGNGRMSRDFTYIDDLVAAILGLVPLVPPPPGAPGRGPTDSPDAPYRVVNLGASQPVELEAFIAALEKALGRKARRKYLPMQPGDVKRTYADATTMRELLDIGPMTPLDAGVAAFLEWLLPRMALERA